MVLIKLLINNFREVVNNKTIHRHDQVIALKIHCSQDIYIIYNLIKILFIKF